MSAATLAAAPTDTRQRLIDAATSLFIRHSFAGTSLQMIADELGLTKAAIYHHFRTREQLLTAVLEPIIGELRMVVEEAETLRGAHARRVNNVAAGSPGRHIPFLGHRTAAPLPTPCTAPARRASGRAYDTEQSPIPTTQAQER